MILSIIFGLCIGSFLNVCALRWKSKESLFFPSSHCPQCGHSLQWFENIPVLSFIFLKGQCRLCHNHISLQYPLVELITGFFFGLATFFYPFKMITLSESFIFSAFLILLTVTDLKWKLLPHSFTHLFLMIGLVLSCIPKIHLLLSPAQSLLGMLVGGGLLLIISELVPGGMGGGDVKFASGLGSWLGLYGLLRVFIIAFLLGGLTAGSLLFLKKANRKTAIALGPFLSVGALLVWFFPNVVGFWMKGIAL